MRADILLNNKQLLPQPDAQALCQWETGAYQALRSMALALKTQGVDHETIAAAVQTSLDALANECPEDNHTEQLSAAHTLLGYTSVEETLQSLVDDALMDDDPETAREIVCLIQASAAPLAIEMPADHTPTPLVYQPTQ